MSRLKDQHRTWILFCNARSVLQEIKDAHISGKSTTSVIDRYLKVDYLLIDEFPGSTDPGDLKKLDYIIEIRTSHGRRTAMTTRMSETEMHKAGFDRIISRFKMGAGIIDLTRPGES